MQIKSIKLKMKKIFNVLDELKHHLFIICVAKIITGQLRFFLSENHNITRT